jgi:hypothetical protein
MQAIHISQHEYINAFGTDGWRKSVRNSVNSNYDYRFPPAPEPEQSALSASRMVLRDESPQPQPQPAAVAHPFRDEAFRSTGATSPAPPQTQAQQAASAPPSNPPQRSAVAHPGIYPACPEHLGDPVGRGEAFRSTGATSPAPPQTQAQQPASAPPSNPPQPAATPNPSAKATPPQPAEIPASCHSACPDLVGERSDERPTSGASPESDREEPAFSSHSPLATRHSPLPSAHALHFDHSCRLRIDGKPF